MELTNISMNIGKVPNIDFSIIQKLLGISADQFSIIGGYRLKK